MVYPLNPVDPIDQRYLYCQPQTTHSFFSALLFAVHPVQTQAVTYIVQRLASLSTLLYLLSLCLYINGRLAQHKGSNRNIAWGFYTGSAAIAAIGMFTKETVFTLPLTIALYEFLFFKLKKHFQVEIFHWHYTVVNNHPRHHLFNQVY